MHVGFVTRKFPPTLSGMSTYALNLCRTLRDLGHRITVLAQYRPEAGGGVAYGDAPPQAVPGIEVIGVPQRHEMERGDFEADVEGLVARLESLHRTHPFDVLHGQFAYPPGLAAVLSAGRLGLPALVSVQGGDGHWFGTCCDHHRRTMRWLLSHASGVLFPTASFRAMVEERYGTVERGAVLPGATDPETFRRSAALRARWRERLGLEPDRPLFCLFHGRVDLRKGLGELVEAFATLPEPVAAAVRLGVAGSGPDDATVQRALARALPPDRFIWLGRLPHADMPGLLSAADVHCSPTHREGFSNTLVEAAACSLPLVTTDATGVRDVFTHGETAWMVPIEDAPALRVALATVCTDAGLRDRLAANARRMVEERYSWRRVGDDLVARYRRAEPVVLAEPPPPIPEDLSCRFRDDPLLL